MHLLLHLLICFTIKFLPAPYQTAALCAVTHGVQSEGNGDFKQVTCCACGTVLEHGCIGFPVFQQVIEIKIKEYTKIKESLQCLCP